MEDRRISKTVEREKNAGLIEPIIKDNKTITENVMNSLDLKIFLYMVLNFLGIFNHGTIQLIFIDFIMLEFFCNFPLAHEDNPVTGPH